MQEIADKDRYEKPGIAVHKYQRVLDDRVAVTELGGGYYRVTVTGQMQMVEFTLTVDTLGLEWLQRTDTGWRLFGNTRSSGVVVAAAADNDDFHFSLTQD